MKSILKGWELATVTFVLMYCAGFAFAQESARSALLGSRGRLGSRAASAPAASVSDDGASAGLGSNSIEFNGAPIDMVLEVYGKLVGRTILKDPSTPNATITLKPLEGQVLTPDEKIKALESVLEMNDIHVEEYGDKFMRAFSSKESSKKIVTLHGVDEKLDDNTRVVSVMIPFKNIGFDEAQKALEGFKSNSGLLQVFERTNSILVTDTQMNINRMLEIARTIDVATPVLENVFVRQIKNASAADIKTALEQIVQESQKELEKNGKGAQNAQNQTERPFAGGASLLRRPGAANQPKEPVSAASLVTSVSDADRGLIRGKVVIQADERSNKLIVITMKSNMDFFDKLIEQLDVETTPDVKVEVIRLKYADAEDVSDMINDLIGNSSSSKGTTKANQNQNAKAGGSGNLTRGGGMTAARATQPANQRANNGESKAGELSKDNVTVLADKRINGLVVMARREDMPTLHEIIESMDVKLSQVLIETAIIEVSLGDDFNTGVDWVQRGKSTEYSQVQRKDSYGRDLYWKKNDDGLMEPTTDITDLPIMDTVAKTVRDGLVNAGNYMLGGGGGAGTDMLRAMVSTATNLVWGGANPIGSGVNYFLKSDKLNLAAVIQASKSDSRTKYIASPIVMTLDNKEAIINATKMRYLLKGFQSSGNSYSTIAVPDYEQKEVGIEIKVTPKINPNGTVMLTVEEKYSQISGSQNIKYATGSSGSDSQSALQDVQVPLTVTREMSADVLLENMQTVVFGGLTETFESEEETGIPILKDIPWIGKWLFGKVVKSETRSELLIFMTPYVLDEGEMAQAEALRRKNAMSDPRPWTSHGWSASALADPVEKKELLRRLKDEAKKQDEERQTKLAIEKWKMDRAKALEKMSESERKFWIEQHREELEKEEKEFFDQELKKQEDLKALADSIKQSRMEKAEATLKEAEEATRAENERARLDAEKAKENEAVSLEEAEK